MRWQTVVDRRWNVLINDVKLDHMTETYAVCDVGAFPRSTILDLLKEAMVTIAYTG